MAAPRIPMVMAAGVLLLGMVLVAAAVFTGEAEVHLALVFPIISGSGPIMALGTLLLILGFVLMFVSMASRLEETPLPAQEGEVHGRAQATSPQARPAPRAEFGGVVFIGPVPVVFGSGSRMRGLMLVAAIVIAILLIVSILAGML